MSKIGETLSDQVSLLLRNHYVKLKDLQLETEVSRMKQIIDLIASFHKKRIKKESQELAKANYKSELHQLIDDVWSKPDLAHFSKLYPELSNAFVSIFSELNEKITETQSWDRFRSAEEDSSWIRFIKSNKRLAFGFSKNLNRVTDTFKKNKSQVTYWSHTIPLRNLATTHFHSGLIADLQDVTRIFFSKINSLYLELKIWENELTELQSGKLRSKADLVSTIEKFKKEAVDEINEKLNAILTKRSEKFRKDYERAGTLEFSNGQLSDKPVKKKLEIAETNWSKNHRDWKNASYALFEEWRSDLDLYILQYKTLAELKDFQSGQIRKLGEFIDPEINAIRDFITEAEHSLDKKQDSISKTLKKINYQANKTLDKELVPRLCDKLSGQDITNLINKLEVNIRQNVEALSDEHVIVKSTNYDKPIKSDELASISPYELIAFETLAAFQEELKTIKKDLFAALEKTTSGSTDLDHIITFSLTSAIASIEDEGKSEDESLAVAKEGLKRAKNRLNENRVNLETAMLENSQRLEEIVMRFCEKIMELTVNENLGELRLRITKAKAAKQAEAVKIVLKERLKSQKNNFVQQVSSSYSWSLKLLSSVSDQFILTAKKPSLSKEVSDFLLESNIAIDRLPLIYRRLYQIEPLKDLELFVGREKELQNFKEAFDSWNQGRYATTVILGEKWGGLSTFINYALKVTKMPYSVVRIAAKENISTESGLLKLFHNSNKSENPESLDQLIQILNEGPKKVIVLEDLQNIYLRKVDGFAALQSLFQLITLTNQNVFWVTTTTIYTWSYLSKTINIAEYFSYKIEMGNLSSSQMIDIIWKRNRISGFNIRFEPNPEQADDKKFTKLSPADQQQELKEEFFEGLNEFAKSNVSLALIFWLLSTKSINEDTITIGSFNKPNLNFLRVLSTSKLHALHALVLHDGLSDRQLSEVISLTLNEARLMLLALVEDGIIFLKKDIYMVNSIVYRDTISLLKSRNLIH